MLYQEGTFCPDWDHRWMGSLAMDRVGNIALGFSLAGPTTSPSIRVTGRLADDPLGEMTLAEFAVQDGSGQQVGMSRWGDYSTVAVDPSDDCTLWYTQEYVASTGTYVWQTRAAAFKFDSCRPTTIFFDGFESGSASAWSVVVP